ncbi:hypothetical protein CONLIGDRAFT_659306 [Coniochaeta ligniaria NRRL 30616]|uniref:AB hydrolase-1 domain-containing protein n=1 Tax=Coniochaeta ligniaria NRRL 30616 TaxID=1408157 RepID=A0A1J7JZN4_9PEZI|nr:hypothetical protein CONLIGDRAFT_659306 [Coniochaeta ligniaria NRRL 30616]
MKKTLLLCFIHGFKGDEKTFGTNYAFTEHLRQLVARELPKVEVRVLVYPTYDTRGDLVECVSRFRDWLLEKVIDLEVQSNTPSPTIDPSVRTILIGHSMGGIVAAETAIALTSEHPIHGSTNPEKEEASNPNEDATTAPSQRPPTPNSLMFPYIQGVLAFDTPFLGISPGVVAHGAEEKYVAASSVVAQLGGLAGLWGGNQQAQRPGNTNRGTAGALPASTSPASEYASSRSASATAAVPDRAKDDASPWNRWGKIAMYAGAVGAVAAGGAAAYMNRDQITTGWGWVSSHLEFVGCLARKEELRRRVAYMVRLNRDLGVGFGNHYTRLGRAASSKQVGMVGTVLGSERTFCVVPKREAAGEWKEAVNDAATDEIGAHMAMFEPKENPGYEKLVRDAASMVKSWLNNDWYEDSSKDRIGG